MFAVIEVADVTVKLLIRAPGNESRVVPCCQWVLVPTMFTGRVAPCPAVAGETLLITAGPGPTYTALYITSTWVPVLTVRLRQPRAVVGCTYPSTVNEVSPVTLTLVSVMPTPKSTAGVFVSHFVA